MSPRFLIIQVIGAGLFLAAWWLGWPQYLFETDSTHLTAVIALLALAGLIAASLGRWQVTEFLISGLPRYGLLGTVVGLAIVASNSGGNFESILGGMSTAFNTTIAGLMGAEWLRLTRQLA